MKKIGLLTFHRAHNYGAMLQAYALTKKVSESNNIELIDYYNKKIYSQYEVIRPVRKNLLKFSKQFAYDLIHYSKNKKRYMQFDKFICNKFVLSKKYNENLKNESKNLDYDVIITGSDQVWNKGIVGELSDIYTLNFKVKEGTKKISYAASIGDVSQIIDNKKIYKDKLSSLNYISVRESDAKNELSKMMNKNVEEVLDPTLLLTKNEWDNEIKGLSKENEKYILAYVVEPDDEYVKIVNDLSEKTGLKVLHFGLKNPGYKNVYKSAYTDGPLNFINYIKNAEYVIATSFHATVFSIIYNKKFFIVPHRKTGMRVISLLDKLGIDKRVFYNYQDFKSIDYSFDTDWNSVNDKLEEERKKSISWLNSAINDEVE